MDSGETPERAAGRELAEVGVSCTSHTTSFTHPSLAQETGSRGMEAVTPSDHVITHVSQKTKLCLHFYAKKVRRPTTLILYSLIHPG